MARRAKVDVTMKERLKEFDPGDRLADDCAAIFAMLSDQGRDVTDAFLEAYLANSGLDKRLSAVAIDKLRAEIMRYVREKFTDLRSEVWADSGRACIAHARKHGISVRTVLVAMSTANERVCDIIWDQTGQDDGQRRRLMRAMLRLSMVEAELVCAALATHVAKEEEEERELNGTLFEPIFTSARSR